MREGAVSSIIVSIMKTEPCAFEGELGESAWGVGKKKEKFCCSQERGKKGNAEKGGWAINSRTKGKDQGEEKRDGESKENERLLSRGDNFKAPVVRL